MTGVKAYDSNVLRTRLMRDKREDRSGGILSPFPLCEAKLLLAIFRSTSAEGV